MAVSSFVTLLVLTSGIECWLVISYALPRSFRRAVFGAVWRAQSPLVSSFRSRDSNTVGRLRRPCRACVSVRMETPAILVAARFAPLHSYRPHGPVTSRLSGPLGVGGLYLCPSFRRPGSRGVLNNERGAGSFLVFHPPSNKCRYETREPPRAP